MIIIKYIFLVVIAAIASILNLILAPIVVLFASEDGWLPRWLWWFQTPDNPLDGDYGWITEHRRYKIEKNKFQRWINRTFWLYRNAMYGLDIDVLGCTIQAGFEYNVIGSETIGNFPLEEGLVKRYLTNPDGTRYFQWYFIYGWPASTPFLKKSRCVRINLGWKLWGEKTPGLRKQLVFSFNPLMRCTRKST